MSVKRILIFILVHLASFQMYAQKGLELPRIAAGEIIIHHKGHTLSYNPEWILPNWVAYELRAEELEGDAERSTYFSPDPLLAQFPCAEHWHDTNSGWVRGHMIPAGDLKYDQEAMNDSFYTSNVCPMNMTFNNSIWKRLEEKARKWAAKYGYIYIITGPVMGQNIHGKVGNSNIMIPDKFYKAVLIPYKGSFLAIGFIMDNDEGTQGKLKDYAVTIDSLEKQIGIDLFVNLPFLTAYKIESLLPLKELELF